MRLPIVAAVLMTAAPAAAEDGFYVGLGGGGVFTPDLDTSFSGPSGSGSGDLSLEPGFGVLGTAGYEFPADPNTSFILGLEGEVGYRRSHADSYSGTAVTAGFGPTTGNLDLDGHVDAWSFMANGRAGIDTGTVMTPFVMVGAGMARIGADGIETAGVTLVDDTDWVFAYQAGAGLNLDFGGGLSAEGSYRYLGTADPEFTAADGVTQVDGQYRNHSIMVMLKFALGQ